MKAVNQANVTKFFEVTRTESTLSRGRASQWSRGAEYGCPLSESRAFLCKLSQAKMVAHEETVTINLHGKVFEHSQTQKITSLRSFLIPSDTPC